MGVGTRNTDNLEVLKVDKSNWAKIKLMRGVHSFPLAYVVRQHNKMAYISLGYVAYLNLDEEMNARVYIVDVKSNLKMTWDSINRVYVD